jgi:hypothetical protein
MTRRARCGTIAELRADVDRFVRMLLGYDLGRS